ncbi:hypothetical protein [Streptomyces sp. NPDC002540]
MIAFITAARDLDFAANRDHEPLYESHLGADTPCRIARGVDLRDRDSPQSRVAWEAAAGQDWRQLEVAVGVTGDQAQSNKGLPSQ